MVVDTSAIIAILMREEGWRDLIRTILGAPAARLSAATLVEAGIVVEGRSGPPGAERLDRLLEELNVEIVAVTAEQAALARLAFRRFGKGRHPAALNFGDCFAYALAKSLGEPLLFRGDDFARTDIQPAGIR